MILCDKKKDCENYGSVINFCKDCKCNKVPRYDFYSKKKED